VSGKDAEKIQDFTTINLNTAQRIVEACEKAADAQGVKISAYVLDNDGDYVYMDRMDGQGYLNIITAEMKARTALMGRQPSKIRMNRVIEDPNAELPQIQLGFFPNSGGLPIAINHQLIGAVGVGGSAPKPPVWSDEICAHKALTEVIGAANTPPLVQDMPVQRNRNQAKRQCPNSSLIPRRNLRFPPSSSYPEKAPPLFWMRIRFRWPRRRRSRAPVAIMRRHTTAACRC
jgi:uncharacterized protein GlcG (DUF336 family)